MSQTTELKPCPFCGNDELGMEPVYECGEVFGFAVNCPRCESSGRMEGTREGAAGQWNTRAADTLQPDAGLVGALENIGLACEEGLGDHNSYEDLCSSIQACTRQALAAHREGEQWSDLPPKGDGRKIWAKNGMEMWTVDGKIYWHTPDPYKWYGPITPPGGK